MAFKIKWSPEAYDDLQNIADYIQKDSPHFAVTVVDKILQTVKVLEGYPESGRVVPETSKKSVRELFLYSYRIIYEVTDASVLIIGIVHGKRLLDNVDDRFK